MQSGEEAMDEIETEDEALGAVSSSTDSKGGLLSVEAEMGKSYLDYAMSVIVSRALPDVRDGMKPVHRRIVYAMEEGGYSATKPYRKSARIVGDVMGKYHPHGDSAIYDTLVRLAQPWQMRAPLVDGQGNFGSLDGDPPAAMRYTEARMTRLSHDMTADIEKDTVDFRPTYDGSGAEPCVLPTRVPNLLVNGSEGIAVGMATKIPTHNLGEVIDACLAWMDDPTLDAYGLMQYLPGPDFPTRGVIVGVAGIREAYATGRGSIRISGVAEIENLKGGRTRIVISELPYGVNKAKLQEKIVELVNEKVIEGVTSVRDESDRKDSVRVVVDVRRDVDPSLVLNKLRRHTQFVTSFGVNAVCLDSRGRPRTMGLVEMISEFVIFRRQVIRRRTVHDLDKARDSLHRQIGLYAAISMVDEVVRIIRGAPDVDAARASLMALDIPTGGAFAELLAEADPDNEVGSTFRLSDIQANAILALSLRNLTGMERDRIADRARELSSEIKGHLTILNDAAVLDGILRTELDEVKAKYPMERQTRIEPSEMDALSDEDLIERRDVVITLTRSGYVKRTMLDAYREQRRGGKGRSGMETKDDDFVTTTLVCTTRTPLLFFTSTGIAHALKAYVLPEAAPNAKGRPLVNYVPLSEGETITAVLEMPEHVDDLQGKSLIFVTDFGTVRRNAAREFAEVRKNGKIAVKLDDDNGNPVGRLIGVLLADDKDDVILATRRGMVTRFPVADLRVFSGRNSTGVRGIALAKGDDVISASILRSFQATAVERQAYLDGGTTRWKEEGEERSFELDPGMMQEMRDAEQELLTLSALGFGKRSSAYAYRTTGRGGKGVAAALINATTGDLAACFPVAEEDGLVIITDGGQTIRTRASDVRQVGRTGRGVRMFRLPDGQKIVSVARVSGDEVSDEDVLQARAEDPDAEAALAAEGGSEAAG